MGKIKITAAGRGARCALILAVLLTAGCKVPAVRNETIVQVSTIDALMAGAYAGQMTLAELLKHGDTGIGTFEHLDGEMIVLDGKVFQAKADGTIARPPLSMSTPFAAVTAFKADRGISIRNDLDRSGLEQTLDRICPGTNTFYAIEGWGAMRRIKTRSVPAQAKPYPPLLEASQHQAVFEKTNVTGWVVGFKVPALARNLNLVGYHLHFLADDKSIGGHILDLEISSGDFLADACHRFELIMPANEFFLEGVNLSLDRAADLNRVEKDR